MAPDAGVVGIIAGMALVTYGTRIAGYWVVRSVSLAPRVRAGLTALPGSILAALIAPTVLATGAAETGAAVVTVALAARAPLVVAVVGGVAAVVALRQLTG